jgi:hypothetical protein
MLSGGLPITTWIDWKNITTGAKYAPSASRKIEGRISIGAHFCDAVALVPKSQRVFLFFQSSFDEFFKP